VATLRQIRRQIKSVQNIERVTRAMRMVAAARLRRAQENVLAARPYAHELQETIGSLIVGLEGYEHPLLTQREANRHLLVVVAADRGLCGSFNTNVIRKATERLAELPSETGIICIGKRANDFFSKRNYNVIERYVDLFRKLSHADALAIARDIITRYSSAEYDRIEVVFNEFRSVMQQDTRLETLLPIPVAEADEGAASAWEYLYEPTREAVLDSLLPKQVNTQVWRVLLESYASEQGARMTAMENASKNAADMIGELTLQGNRVRQTMITKEIAEIVGGAEALKYS